jgi:uncharacterized membrane protein YidH (DUF202 family)
MPAGRTQPPVIDPANRTRLAWTRTAVAFAAIGGAMLKLSPVAGLAVLVLSLPIWAVARGNRGTDLSLRGLRLVTVTVVIIAIAALVVAIFGRSPDSLGQLLRG